MIVILILEKICTYKWRMHFLRICKIQEMPQEWKGLRHCSLCYLVQASCSIGG
jgi:hypothetical protein